MERPAGVTILASLYFFVAGIIGFGSVLLIFGASFFSGMAGPDESAKDLSRAGLFFLVVALLDLICGIGFIKLKKWSLVLAIVFHSAWAILWALSLVGLRLHPSLASGVFRLLAFVIQLWILAYLLRPKVKKAFGMTVPDVG